MAISPKSMGCANTGTRVHMAHGATYNLYWTSVHFTTSQECRWLHQTLERLAASCP